jgi:diguanylate cyclase (GGDEF)-like protein
LQIEHTLDALLLGSCPSAQLDVHCFPKHLHQIIHKLNECIQSVQEMHVFAMELSKGNLDIETPNRRNYISSPLKEIHSQLISFCWSIEQLISGKMVSKLYYPGKLLEYYNALIEKVSIVLSNQQESLWGASVTSWRYHQILSAINQLHIMILEVNREGVVMFANPPARELFYEMDKLPYNDPTAESGVLTKYLCTFSDVDLTTFPCIHPSEKFPVLHELYDASSGAWYKITSDCVKLADGSMGLLHMIDDISEWKRHEQQLKLSATIDALTPTYTRRAGIQKLEELIERRFIESNCIAFIDIDGLKNINDNSGHTEGDKAIKQTADILLSSIRKTDWVVRYGGDEFLVFFFGCTEDVAQMAVNRMYKMLRSENASSERNYKLSFSVGLSLITEEMSQISDVIMAADRKMYENKLIRKNQPN